MTDDKTLLSRRTVLKGSGASLGAAAVGLGGLAYSSTPVVAADVDGGSVEVSNDGGSLSQVTINPTIDVEWENFPDEGPTGVTISVDEVRWWTDTDSAEAGEDGSADPGIDPETIAEGDLTDESAGSVQVDFDAAETILEDATEGFDTTDFEPEQYDSQDNYVEVDVTADIDEPDGDGLEDTVTFYFVVTVDDTENNAFIDQETSEIEAGAS